ncbi:hypothetical protein ACTZWT_06770 [Rhodopseudomonas sp. NSM]|uniref:hypothetical protein n=1 Tax=Rhodopseudomonas sp. NSM TaxID=3457630 RepID=UPI004037261C
MARSNPNDPYQPPMPADDPRTRSSLDSELQADPELQEGPATGGRIAAFAVAIVLVFAAVFYGMNSTATDPGAPAISTTQNSPDNSASQAAQTAPPAGVRDVTPRNNAQPGTTTGAAPSRDQPTPPLAAPSGSAAAPTGAGASK